MTHNICMVCGRPCIGYLCTSPFCRRAVYGPPYVPKNMAGFV